jgi:photosystem II cytochrome c550
MIIPFLLPLTMLYQFITRFFLVSTALILMVTGSCLPAQAGGIEPYISRY